ncbi:MAG: primosomal protein N' [Bernardetiaceae bacterium]
MLERQTPTHQERATYFVEVILPVPVMRYFTYRLPFELNDFVQVGCRVLVPFGNKRLLTAVVVRLHQTPPEDYTTKYVLDLLDETPLITTRHIQFWQWTADYYLAPIGDVMNAALPNGLKMSSQSQIQRHPLFDPDQESGLDFSPAEQAVVTALQSHDFLSYEAMEKLLQGQKVYPVIKSLLSKEVILIFDEVKEKYKPSYIKKIRLAAPYRSPEDFQALLQNLEDQPRKEKQVQILLQYRAINSPEGVEKKDLLQPSKGKPLSSGSLKSLLDAGILEAFEEIKPRFPVEAMATSLPKIQLSDYQKEAVQQAFQHFHSGKSAVLLHGITGSGKTEVYIQLIQEALANGMEVLFLLPEIALTTQIVARLQRVFGKTMGVYHSSFSDNERVEVWRSVAEGQVSFVAGVRSAIFLPFKNLGLIIVDEEHDASYKQYDPSPRYNARDLSLVLGQLQGTKVVLGSATPAVESYFLSQEGVYGLVELKQRFGDFPLPAIVPVDLRTAKAEMKAEFSGPLIREIEEALQKNEQVILFQNRRGYAPFLTCESCGWIPKCPNCAVSLTYHLHSKEIRCHYCGHHQASPPACAACGSTKIRSMRFGTEKLEDDLQLIFPQARVARMDRDTTRTRTAYERLIRAFEQHEIDILVGTQMVSKGLDFERVNLVGVFDADRMLHFPDFRAFERTFQLITQVSGRAGRHSHQGKVLIQTYQPEQDIFQKIKSYNYFAFYQQEIRERELHFYPPFSRLIKITTKHEEQARSRAAAQALAQVLLPQLTRSRLLGPEAPLIERIRNRYLFDILIKLERKGGSLKATKTFINDCVQWLGEQKDFRQVQVVIDVDCV